ncbi:GxxExxY protein [Sorangium cellulosum]|uniref:GxxExxY protein n=1 Tax=Sorangium cellulosum TaxID=56 RepID=A0A150RLZ0_SORCE|nr:GxxExxY protein [Sorangium cellulosum]
MVMNHRGTEGTEEEENEPDAELRGLTRQVIGAAIEVHRVLGPGFLESIYEEALGVELSLRRVSFRRQVAVRVDYKGRVVGEGRVDLLVADRLLVELKAVEHLAPIHMAQLLSYLKATKIRHGLLVTFNVPALRLGLKRVINDT